MRTVSKIIALAISVLSIGCASPVQTDTCDETKARQVVFTDDVDKFPAYEGQALIINSCANGFCHTEGANGSDRYGAPKELDFDVSIAFGQENNVRLSQNQERTNEWREAIFTTIERETMPPGDAGDAVVGLGPFYVGLPVLDSDAGREIVRNWLSCGSPVVERTNERPAGSEPVGEIVRPD